MKAPKIPKAFHFKFCKAKNGPALKDRSYMPLIQGAKPSHEIDLAQPCIKATAPILFAALPYEVE